MQQGKGLAFSAHSILTAWTDTGRTAICTRAGLHQIKTMLDKLIVQIVEALAETDAGWNLIVNDNGWLCVSDG